MTVHDFIRMIAAAVREEVRAAPPKKFDVKRVDIRGRESIQKEVSLPELLAENTDQMRINAQINRELIHELQQQRKLATEIQKQRQHNGL